MPKIWKTWIERRLDHDRTQADREALRRADYKQTFGTEQGQRVLADICARCGVMNSTFHPGQPDVTAFMQGRQRAALEIVETLSASPDDVLRLARTGNTEELFHAQPEDRDLPL